MTAIQKKIVVDEQGNPQEVIIPWAQFCELMEELGGDLDAEAAEDLRATRTDWGAGKKDSFTPLSEI